VRGLTIIGGVTAGCSVSADHNTRYPIDPVLLAKARELRSSSAPAEPKLWSLLRNRQPGGLKFRRQHPILPYVADFYCDEVRLVIELDGPSHDGRVERDAVRTAFLKDRGYTELRFVNDDVHKHLDGVCAEILRVANGIRLGVPPSP
jgi:very-short-patch-repair endonuclease